MADVLVRCVTSRMIGDDRYYTGEEYLLSEDRASRYHDYFIVLGAGPAIPAPGTTNEKMIPAPPNKRRGAPQNKSQV